MKHQTLKSLNLGFVVSGDVTMLEKANTRVVIYRHFVIGRFPREKDKARPWSAEAISGRIFL